MPYFIYPVLVMTGLLDMLEGVSDGYVGLIKSLLFSFLIIAIVALLNKFKIKLKV